MEEPENITAKIVGAIYSFIALAVSVLNILILIVIICNKSLHNSTYAIVANLVVCNLIYSLVVLPSHAVTTVLEDWVFGNILCKIIQQSTHMLPLIQAISLFLLVLDHYLASIKPFTSASTWQTRRIMIGIAVMWLVAFLCTIHLLVLSSLETYDYFSTTRSVCTQNLQSSVYRQIQDICHVLLSYTIPLVANIILLLLRCCQRKPDDKDDLPAGFSPSSLPSIIVTVVVFSICVTPFNVLFFMTSLRDSVAHWYWYIYVFYTTQSLHYISFMFNPFLFCIMNESFRKCLHKLCYCK